MLVLPALGRTALLRRCGKSTVCKITSSRGYAKLFQHMSMSMSHPPASFQFKVSFANGLRLWLQLVRDVTVVPSAMGHFRVLHEELRERAQRGDVWVLTRALEEVSSVLSARGRGWFALVGAMVAVGGGGGRSGGVALCASSQTRSSSWMMIDDPRQEGCRLCGMRVTSSLSGVGRSHTRRSPPFSLLPLGGRLTRGGKRTGILDG